MQESRWKRVTFPRFGTGTPLLLAHSIGQSKFHIQTHSQGLEIKSIYFVGSITKSYGKVHENEKGGGTRANKAPTTITIAFSLKNTL